MKYLLCSVICLYSIIFGLSIMVNGLPVLDLTKNVDGLNNNATILEEDGTNSTNGSDYYVIRAVIYEIGILTNSDDDDNITADSDPLTHQRVDLSFYDAQSNGSDINLGDIPLPIQTNVSGQIITGIAPFHIGSVGNISEILSSLPLTGSIVNITQSDSAIINLSTHNQTLESQLTHFNNDLTNIPSISNSIPVFSDAVNDVPNINTFNFF